MKKASTFFAINESQFNNKHIKYVETMEWRWGWSSETLLWHDLRVSWYIHDSSVISIKMFSPTSQFAPKWNAFIVSTKNLFHIHK
jgi:hypothetical protein